MGEVVSGPWASETLRPYPARTAPLQPVQTKPLTGPCPHETPGGSQRCALCRAEVALLHDGPRRRPRRPWLTATPLDAVPMPDHVRDTLRALRDGTEPPPAPEQGALL